jgi:hypothetical protein
MTLMVWMLWTTLSVIYIVCLFTVCSITFRKGHVALGIFGIFPPFLVADRGNPAVEERFGLRP